MAVRYTVVFMLVIRIDSKSTQATLQCGLESRLESGLQPFIPGTDPVSTRIQSRSACHVNRAYYGLAVRMAQKQDGSSNQCVSI